jgi:hypothetical protein
MTPALYPKGPNSPGSAGPDHVQLLHNAVLFGVDNHSEAERRVARHGRPPIASAGLMRSGTSRI